MTIESRAIGDEADSSAQSVLTSAEGLTLAEIFRTWWPLAAGWVILSIGSPIVIAVVARLPDPDVNLAALGGIVRAVTFAIESPLLAILTASAALSTDWVSYRVLRRYSWWGIGLLTAVHAAIAFTPLYDLLITRLMSVPPEIIEPGRYGLMLTTPFLAAVVLRRFIQGMLIRFGRSGAVAEGTVIRLATNTVVMLTGFVARSIPGVLIAAAAMSAGVWTEAGYAAFRARPVIRHELKKLPRQDSTLRGMPFLRFYLPLATTHIAMFALQPITSAALSRMPLALVSLAVFPAVWSVAWLLASGGTALVEVVVTLLDRPDAVVSLRRFTLLLAGMTALFTLALAATPLGTLWFGTVSGLSPALFVAARQATWWLLPYPALIVIQGAYQGVLTYGRRTRAITEAVVISVLVTMMVLGIGARWGRFPGAQVGVGAWSLGAITQTIWLRHRGQKVLRAIKSGSWEQCVICSEDAPSEQEVDGPHSRCKGYETA